jgi:hypothetical protein
MKKEGMVIALGEAMTIPSLTQSTPGGGVRDYLLQKVYLIPRVMLRFPQLFVFSP